MKMAEYTFCVNGGRDTIGFLYFGYIGKIGFRLDLIILLFHLKVIPQELSILQGAAEMIAKDLQPLSVVEDEGLRSFVRTLDPCYRILSRKNFMEEKIPTMYEECCSKVKKISRWCKQCCTYNRHVNIKSHRGLFNCLMLYY